MDSYIDHPIINQYRALVENLCAPLFWRKANGEMLNGTVTFLRTATHVLGITNKHVVDHLTDTDGRGWQLGCAQFEPDRIIARHPKLDLATIQLSEVYLTTAGKCAASIPEWPPKHPALGSAIALGGYPAETRVVDAGRVIFDFVWFAGKVQVEGNSTTGMVLNIADSIPTTQRRILKGAKLNGCSGGPVFSVLEKGQLEYPELAAIIYQCSDVSETVLAHPLNILAEDGTFID